MFSPRHLVLLLPLLLGCEVIESQTLPPGSTCNPDAPLRCEGPAASCLPLGGGAGVCTHACLRDAECPGGLTCQADPGGATARCAPGFLCDADTDCPAGHGCDSAVGICYIRVNRGLCSPCSADAQCPEGGRCYTALGTGERFCSVACGAGCPQGYECDGPGGQCIPKSETCDAQRPLCAPCEGDSQCGDGNDLCVKNFTSGERFCGLSCNPACNDGSCTSACPESFRCADLSGDGTGPFQCVPHAGTCVGWCDGTFGCPPGQVCDSDEHTCAPAVDGRACAPCDDDDDCAAGGSRCVVNQSVGESFCAPVCESDGGCSRSAGPGFVCEPVGTAKLCVPAGGTCAGGVGGLGSACGLEGAAACLSGICLLDGDVGLCSARCHADADCRDSNFECCAVVPGVDASRWDCSVRPGEQGGVCAPRGGLFGDGCEPGRPVCQSGHCLDLGTSRLCTAACDDEADCDAASGTPGRFVCRSARPYDAVGDTKICFPAGGGEVGSDCTFGPAACIDRLCIAKESGNVCTKACSGAENCPSGWTCGDSETVDGKPVTICMPASISG